MKATTSTDEINEALKKLEKGNELKNSKNLSTLLQWKRISQIAFEQEDKKEKKKKKSQHRSEKIMHSTPD